MSKNAYIKLVNGSNKQSITISEVKGLLRDYSELNKKTGKQLDWIYDHYAFPYHITETLAGEGKWFYLTAEAEGYYLLAVAVDKDEDGEYVQVTLSEKSTFGDKAKAVDFCKFIGDKLKGEVHLFNEKVMYFYPRK